VVRADRLGDVVLSTPVIETIKRHYPRSHVSMLVRENVVPLLQGLSGLDEVLVYRPEAEHSGFRGILRLARELGARNFRIAVVLQSQWPVAASLLLAGVRYRIGPLSKPHSYLFYNRGVRQRRSYVEMHETDYNLQLLRRLGIRITARAVEPTVHLADPVRLDAREWLRAQGSALNWPENHYLSLIRALLRDGRQVLVTGGPPEAELLARMRAELAHESQSAIVYGGGGAAGVDFLAGLFDHCSVVIAPSTGPLHVAAALGKPVVTFYPPIRVQSALRWGPYVSDEGRASILVPEVYCGQDFTCRGNQCNYFPCMSSLSVAQAMEAVNMQLARAQTVPSASAPAESRQD
jgi:ADP-heptose:LPS heptosyltransferase